MNGGYARRKHFRHITAGCNKFYSPHLHGCTHAYCVQPTVGGGYAWRCAVVVFYTLPNEFAAACRSACMHRLPALPGTHFMYDFLVSKSHFHRTNGPVGPPTRATYIQPCVYVRFVSIQILLPGMPMNRNIA